MWLVHPMTQMGMTPKNHPNRLAGGGPVDDGTDDRATHPQDFAELNETYGPFTIDVAASPANTKCARYYTRHEDGLAHSWKGERVWCNPPFSDVGAWVRKAWAEHAGSRGIVMLLPATRTEQPWWQEMVEPYRDRDRGVLITRFLPGRRRFLRPGQTAIGPGERPPFGLVLLIWDGPVTGFPRPVYTGQPAAVDGGLDL